MGFSRLNHLKRGGQLARHLCVVRRISCSGESIADGILSHFVHHRVKHELVGTNQLGHLNACEKRFGGWMQDGTSNTDIISMCIYVCM